jgi:membrane protein
MTARRLIGFADVIRGTVNEFLADNCPHLAAAISFYLFLSLFPLILAAISIFGFVLQQPNVEAKVIEAINDLIPVSSGFVTGIIVSVSRTWEAAGIIAVIGLIWAGMAVFNALRKSLNTAWGIREPRPFFHERMLELTMMMGFGVLMLVSLGLTTFFKIIREASLPVFGDRLTDGGLLWHLAVVAGSIFIAFLGFLFLYKLVPNTKVYWRHAAIGALAAAVLFEIVKNVFVWFVPDFATYNVVYGSVGVIVALMTWAYVSAVILLFCAKLISVYPRIRPALAPEALAEVTAREKLMEMAPGASTILVNMSTLTSGGVGALRRLMLGRG